MTSNTHSQHASSSTAFVGAVVIGRNEGARLQRCLRSLVDSVDALVYVDSQSTDGSVALARSMGVAVVELDLSVPFTAARARNAGYRKLEELHPQVEFVQFVDGDCEVVDGWVEFAREMLAADPRLVAVTGLRREMYPERTVYNRLCDVEWQQGPFGETTKFGGDVMIRRSELDRAGGYNPRVIAAEDDELAVRLCALGGKVLRAERQMTRHDAAMSKLSQWWRRATRCGYGYAQVGRLHGAPPTSKFLTERRRVVTWGVVVPLAAAALAPPTIGGSLLLYWIYPLRAVRIAHRARQSGMAPTTSAAWGLSCAFSSLPEAGGFMKYYLDELLERAPRIIEYKGPETS